MSPVDVPIRIVSVANLREHWAARANRAKQHRRDTWVALMASKQAIPMLPVVVTLTRIAPRPLDDDNAIGGLKNCRDGVADWLGVDDGDERLTWKCLQAKGKPGEYGVRIAFQAAA